MTIRHNWCTSEVLALLRQPFMDLLFQAQQIHRQYHNPNHIQMSTLLSIKTGACPEDCKYCPQSARYKTGVEKEQLLAIEQVRQAALNAKAQGASRFCMGAAWRNPKSKDMPYLTEIIKEVKALGLETCMTLGMLNADQSQTLAKAGLDYYNHNLDTAKEYYDQVITTRSYQDRLDTLENVRQAGIKVCTGGIIGLGENEHQRAGLLAELANLPTHPDSVPINRLVKCSGTPFAENEDVDNLDFIRIIAVARIMMPRSMVRLSAGREKMSEEMQALCFMAGANSIFYGCKLLTTPNPSENHDQQLLHKLGLTPMPMATTPQHSQENSGAVAMYYPDD